MRILRSLSSMPRTGRKPWKVLMNGSVAALDQPVFPFSMSVMRRRLFQQRLMTRLLVAGRLLAPEGVEPPQAAARSLAAACQVETYNDLLRRLGAARQEVAKAWDAILEAQLELD